METCISEKKSVIPWFPSVLQFCWYSGYWTPWFIPPPAHLGSYSKTAGWEKSRGGSIFPGGNASASPQPIYLNNHACSPFSYCCHFREVFSFFCLDHRLLCRFNLLKRNLNLREVIIITKTWWHLQLTARTHTVQLHCKKVSLMMRTGSSPSFQSSMPSVKDMSDICICEIPATTHSQGQCLDLYSLLQIRAGFHSNEPMVWYESIYIWSCELKLSLSPMSWSAS